MQLFFFKEQCEKLLCVSVVSFQHLETTSELVESFTVLASSCLLHFKVSVIVLNFKKCYQIVKESCHIALLQCCQCSTFTPVFRKDFKFDT